MPTIREALRRRQMKTGIKLGVKRLESPREFDDFDNLDDLVGSSLKLEIDDFRNQLSLTVVS
jgi:hypothetical protein